MAEQEKKTETKSEISQPSSSKAETKEKKASKEYVAAILIRGLCKTDQDVCDTLAMLGLNRKNAMVIREKTPSIMGMIKKAKDFITFGDVEEKYAKEFGEKKTVNLHPPRGGFERKGIKVPFKTGGALGNRGPKISELIEKMRN